MRRRNQNLGLVNRSGEPSLPSGDKAVLTPEDFTYLGMGRVPEGSGIGWAFAPPHAITFRRVGGNLHLITTGSMGGGRLQNCHEIVYETPSLSYSTAPVMDLYHNWGNIYDGRRASVGQPSGTGDGSDIYGYCWDEESGMLLWTFAFGYTPEHHRTLCATRFNGTSSFTTYGALRTQCHSKQSNGHICLIPQRHRAAMNGMTAMFGAVQTSVNFLNTWGFSANSFNHFLVDGATPDSISDENDISVPTEEIMKSRLEHKMNRDPTSQRCLRGDASTGYSCEIGPTTVFEPDTIMTQMDGMGGIAWIDNATKHGIVCPGQLVDAIDDPVFRAERMGGATIAHHWYASDFDECCHGQFSDDGGTGPHAATTVPQLWIWDPQLYLDVAAGLRTPQSVANMPSTKHRALWQVGPTSSVPKHWPMSVAGAAYDPVDRIFCVGQTQGDPANPFENQTLFHFWQVAN